MTSKKNILVFIIFIIFYVPSFCQMSEGGAPVSFHTKKQIKIPVKVLPDVSLQIQQRKNKGKSNQFAIAVPVNFSPHNSGIWDSLTNGRVWFLKIRSTNAHSLNIIFSKYKVPPGAKLWLYNKDKSYVLGAFTSINNKTSGKLAVAPVPGDEITIEYFQPYHPEFKADLQLKQVAHDYIGIPLPGHTVASAGFCEVDINCDEGLEWQQEKRSVLKMYVAGTEYCTGTLINNTRNDGTPYVFTARHCIIPGEQIQDIVFDFNYESVQCDGKYNELWQSLSMAELIATTTGPKLDFALLKLSAVPPEEYLPYYAGWNCTGDIPVKTTTIHHPNADLKKISIDNDSPGTDSYDSIYDTDSHWRIYEWDIGATEVGSSGAPLFDTEHYIVGTLTGGEASCNRPKNDFFTKISHAWDHYPEPVEQLKTWLDPMGHNIKKLEGYSAYGNLPDADVELVQIIGPEDEVCGQYLFTPTISIRNTGKDYLFNLSINVTINDIKDILFTRKVFLPTYATLEMNLPQMPYIDSINVLKIELLAPNDVDDPTPENNILYKIFDGNKGEQLSLTLKTDKYANETSWSLKNERNEIIYQNEKLDDETQYNEIFCLREGCYTFQISDSENDGICCEHGEGNFLLKNASTDAIIASGNSFDSIQVVNFCILKDKEKLDVEIFDIINLNETICSSNHVSPGIVVRDIGQEKVDSVWIISHILNSAGNYTYSDSSLFALNKNNEIDTFFMPVPWLDNGFYTYWAEVKLSKYENESNTENNRRESSFNIVSGQNIQFELYTDNFASETTWELKSANGQIIDEGGPYKNTKQYKIKRQYCVENSTCYTLSIYDENGDGICCGSTGNGNHILFFTEPKDTISQGGRFRAALETDFCITPTDTPDINNDEVIIYPVPAKNVVNFKAINTFFVYFRVFTLQGVEVFTKKSISQRGQFDLSFLPAGIYVIQIETEKNSSRRIFMLTQ